jgi:hypothetical protein
VSPHYVDLAGLNSNLFRIYVGNLEPPKLIWENSKNDPVNVLYSEFDPKHLDISINDPLQCVFFA